MSEFKVGDIVTIKSHPLFSKTPQKIKEFPAQVPPLMLVKEVIFEKKDKKKVFNDTIEDARIADLVKYVCVFFNANKSEFVEKEIYQSFLKSYSDLKYFRKTETHEGKTSDNNKTLVDEVNDYTKVETYVYGKRVQLLTKKLEHRKSYEFSQKKNLGSSFQTPDFILSGIKNEEQKDLFFQEGNESKPKRKISEQSYKVMWFNHVQQKFSEQYLPKEFFVEGLEI